MSPYKAQFLQDKNYLLKMALMSPLQTCYQLYLFYKTGSRDPQTRIIWDPLLLL